MKNKAIKRVKPISTQEILNLRLKAAVEGFDAVEAEAVLAAGANPNLKTAYGNPLIYVATAMNKPELVEAFLKAGANKNALGRKGLNAAGIAKSRTIKELLIDIPRTEQVSSPAELQITINTLKKSATCDNYLNNVDEEGNTPLHLAIIAGNLTHVKAILKAGVVDLNIKNNKGATALHLAAMSKSKAILDLIISKTQ